MENQMEILNLGGAGEEHTPPRLKSRKKTKLKIATGIGSLAAITGLGSTLAASISLNSGQPVEFGQGVAVTAACDADGITVTPTSEYVPSTESFRLDTIQLSGINLATPDANTGIGCAGKTLIIRAYTDDSDYERFTVDDDTASPLNFSYGDFGYWPADYYNDGIAITFDSNGDIDSIWTSNDNSGDRYYDVSYSDQLSSYTSAVTINMNQWYSDNPGLDSRAVSKFTVESIDTPLGGLDTNDWYQN
jgi:hypothetical protein